MDGGGAARAVLGPPTAFNSASTRGSVGFGGEGGCMLCDYCGKIYRHNVDHF